MRKHHREPSRPYYQFLHQLSKERERLLAESADGEATITTADINTTAYKNVVETWQRRKIWNDRWGVMPGMVWKHEEPFEEETADSPAPVQTNPLENTHDGTGERPTKRMSGSPLTVEPDHRQASGIMNSSQQDVSAGHGSFVFGNGEANHESSDRSPPRHGGNGGALRSATKQTPRRSKRKRSPEDTQDQTEASTCLGPVHASRISKRAKRSTPGPSSTKPLQTDGICLRRSNRTRPSKPSNDQDPTAFIPTDSQKATARSKPKKTASGNSKSASSKKPQGISKRQRPSAARGKREGMTARR